MKLHRTEKLSCKQRSASTRVRAWRSPPCEGNSRSGQFSGSSALTNTCPGSLLPETSPFSMGKKLVKSLEISTSLISSGLPLLKTCSPRNESLSKRKACDTENFGEGNIHSKSNFLGQSHCVSLSPCLGYRCLSKCCPVTPEVMATCATQNEEREAAKGQLLVSLTSSKHLFHLLYGFFSPGH